MGRTFDALFGAFAIALLTLVAGCVDSDDRLLDPATAATPALVGDWRVQSPDGLGGWKPTDESLRLELQEHTYRIIDTGKPNGEVTPVTLHPLRDDYFIGVISQKLSSGGEGHVYALVRAAPAEVTVFADTCDREPDRSLEKFGFKVRPYSCTAATADGLKAYFTDLIAKSPRPTSRFVRAGS